MVSKKLHKSTYPDKRLPRKTQYVAKSWELQAANEKHSWPTYVTFHALKRLFFLTRHESFQVVGVSKRIVGYLVSLMIYGKGISQLHVTVVTAFFRTFSRNYPPWNWTRISNGRAHIRVSIRLVTIPNLTSSTEKSLVVTESNQTSVKIRNHSQKLYFV